MASASAALANDSVDLTPARYDPAAVAATPSLLSHKRNVHSQNGEDGIVEHIFRTIGIAKGHFVDVGAADGVWLSNTRKLHTEGWSGVCIEAHNDRVPSLRANYAGSDRVVCIHATVGASAPEQHLHAILNRHGASGKHVDFLSVDVDGAELEVLEHMGDCAPTVLCVNIDAGHSPMYAERVPDALARQTVGQSMHVVTAFARNKGYFPLCYTGNLFLVRNEHHALFKAFVRPSLTDIYVEFLDYLKRDSPTLLVHLRQVCVDRSRTVSGFTFRNAVLERYIANAERVCATDGARERPVTLVTAFFPIGDRSKYSQGTYDQWMANFIGHVRTPIVVFTTSAFAPIIKRLRERLEDAPLHVVETDFDSFYTHRYAAHWPTHRDMDVEKTIHSTELYMIWNEKSEFLSHVARHNPFGSRYFVWTDIGCFREAGAMARYTHWPSLPNVVRATCNGERVFLLQLEDFAHDERAWSDAAQHRTWTPSADEDLGPTFTSPDVRIGGGIFGGSALAVERWRDAYYRVLHAYVTQRRFAGKDQYLMATLVLGRPEMVSVVRIPPNLGSDPWFYLHHHLRQVPILDHIVYINLDHRTNRRFAIEQELASLHVDLRASVERLAAVHVPTRGALGCTRSHILALEKAMRNDWPYVIVLEDDFTIPETTTFERWMEFMTGAHEARAHWDVLLLVGYVVEHTDEVAPWTPTAHRVHTSQTTAGYIVQKHYYERLLSNFRESEQMLARDNPTYATEALDQHWKQLQRRDRWYISTPMPLAQQRARFSDIEMAHRDCAYML